MSDLLADSVQYDINIKIFNKLQNTITGWPGGGNQVGGFQ
jgi:glucosamine-6-phosphate deaminase